MKIFTRYSLSNKFASRPIDVRSGSVDGGLKSSTSTSAHPRTPSNQTQTAPKVSGDDDMLSTMLQQHKPFNRSHIYDEDDEVIQYDHWDDAWQKNDVENSEENEDLISQIVSRIDSTDPTFATEIHTFLQDYRDLFSR